LPGERRLPSSADIEVIRAALHDDFDPELIADITEHATINDAHALAMLYWLELDDDSN
jgi:hypothetical protein